MRKVIAERLLFSKTNIPHFYLGIECNVDKLLTLRVQLNKSSPVKISINDMIIKAASLACIKVPETNSSWQGSFIRKYTNVDMSVAVQTDSGLITPIVTNSNLKGLAEISRNVKDLAERAKQQKLKPNEFQGGTFTISNLGMMGISNFSAIINPPQSCILAVGRSEKKVVVDENALDKNSPYKVVNVMQATLSCDHRVVDGAVGARWVQEFRDLIENPELMLL
jgi:pyruvate dehydrogenase E2 component (dihydrolipoamide acetyltransferase)